MLDIDTSRPRAPAPIAFPNPAEIDRRLRSLRERERSEQEVLQRAFEADRTTWLTGHVAGFRKGEAYGRRDGVLFGSVTGAVGGFILGGLATGVLVKLGLAGIM